ncbi:ArnT family glycosyltransferase [Agaribacterium haliotis]|uniref:ArnT family glycosyltransferase n=1 Tax=Agaribacterium haliotis TaxID=2013869 RepID=UPI000BB58C77|nr:hypothetical protein [Agaribacterium haliotis]
MAKAKAAIIVTAILLTTLIALITTVNVNQPKYSNFELVTPAKETIDVATPGFWQSKGTGHYTLRGDIYVSMQGQQTFRIVPDDRIDKLAINGIDVDLNHIPNKARSDYRNGFLIDLSPYLKKGDNTIEASYYDRGGLMGLVISKELPSSSVSLMYLLAFIFVAVFYIAWARKLKLSSPLLIILVFALALRVFYLSQTDAEERSHDVGDHFGYTTYLAENWKLPPVDYAVGGAFFHPPLYYYASAIVYKLTQIVLPGSQHAGLKVLQFFSLFCSAAFLLYGLLLLQKVFWPESDRLTSTRFDDWKSALGSNLKAQTLIIVSLVLACWPSAIIHSIRIGNDPLLYALFAITMYYIYLWYHSDSNRDLIIASALAGATTLTKANGEILIAVIGLLGFVRMIKTKQWLLYLKRSIIPLLIVIPCVGITVGPALILKMEGKRDKLYIDDIEGLSKANIVGNTAANYLWFDAKVFITKPFTDPYDDRYGRQFFWNYLGKTGLVGEFKYPYPAGINSAIILSAVFVFMLIYIFIGLYYTPQITVIQLAPIILVGFVLWAAVTYMRMTFPANIDFRYILPILITFCTLYANSVLQFARIGANRAARIGQIFALIFAFVSSVFILTVN